MKRLPTSSEPSSDCLDLTVSAELSNETLLQRLKDATRRNQTFGHLRINGFRKKKDKDKDFAQTIAAFLTKQKSSIRHLDLSDNQLNDTEMQLLSTSLNQCEKLDN